MLRFIIRRRFSSILRQFSILRTILSNFPGFRVLVLSVCPMVCQCCLKNFWQLFDNFLTTFWHFFWEFWQLENCWQLFYNFDNFLKVFWQPFLSFLATFWQLWQFFKVFWHLFLKSLLTIFWQLLTLFWLLFWQFWQFLTTFFFSPHFHNDTKYLKCHLIFQFMPNVSIMFACCHFF
jgi:hypothetical protein